MNGNVTIKVIDPHSRSDLLPIREAYEWKRCAATEEPKKKKTPTCFQFVKRMNGNSYIDAKPEGYNGHDLLPIREAYEWKPCAVERFLSSNPPPCFQFVKRMNGNRMPGINPISSVKKNPRFQRDYASVGTKISEEV